MYIHVWKIIFLNPDILPLRSILRSSNSYSYSAYAAILHSVNAWAVSFYNDKNQITCRLYKPVRIHSFAEKSKVYIEWNAQSTAANIGITNAATELKANGSIFFSADPASTFRFCIFWWNRCSLLWLILVMMMTMPYLEADVIICLRRRHIGQELFPMTGEFLRFRRYFPRKSTHDKVAIYQSAWIRIH